MNLKLTIKQCYDEERLLGIARYTFHHFLAFWGDMRKTKIKIKHDDK